ncbi:SUKH-4 family immunity protein [Streptomyces albidoflavus]
MRRAPPPPGRSRQMATYGQLTSWAGPGRVTRLRREDVAGRRIPDAMKVPLVETGVPVAPRLTERVTTQREADPSCSPPAARSTAPPSRRTPTPRPSAPRPVSNRRPARSTSPCRTEKRASPTRGPARGWTPFTATAPTSPPRRARRP